MLAVFVQNPKYANKVAGELGMSGATPQELVRAVVLGAPEPTVEDTSTQSNTNTSNQGTNLSGVFTEDDISFMVGNGRMTEEQAQQLRDSGMVINVE
jgi:uncharacterized membrane protein YjjP (DUF1212 family)